jgi:hypothetical protein
MDTKAHEVEVHVKSLKTGETAKFKITETATLQAVWDRAQTELNETRNQGDTFRCSKGDDLSSYLGQTLAAVRDQKICTDLHFEIKGPSGGARA